MKIILAKSWRILLAVIVSSPALCHAQVPAQRQSVQGTDRANQIANAPSSPLSVQSEAMEAKEELQRGTALTRQGRFREAIPHLVQARAKTTNEYAVEFNLSLCYVGVGDYQNAVGLLEGLRRKGHDNADVENLLAQAYVGKGERNEALSALVRAAAISPQNERLFAFVADACADHQDFELGLKVTEIGLRKLPQSARLHYEKAVLLSQLDQFDRAKPDFELATKFGQGTEVGYLAEGQEQLLEGNVNDAIRTAREGISKGIQNPALSVILGTALLRSGIAPGQPEFAEAQNALERAIAERPNDAGSQIALGEIYLHGGQLDNAIAHLQSARQMRPNQPSIYANLAKAYQRKGDSQRAQEALAKLESLNQAQAERIRSAPGERKMSYGGESSPSPQ